MICNNCGNELPNESDYCQYCGNKVKEDLFKRMKLNRKNIIKNRHNNSVYIVVIGILILICFLLTVVLLKQAMADNKAVRKVNNSNITSVGTLSDKYIELSDSYNELYKKYKTTNEELEDLQWDYKELMINSSSEVNDVAEKFFYEKNAEIVGADGVYYHKYGCDDLDLSSYYIFNTENAIAQGYVRCPKCH